MRRLVPLAIVFLGIISGCGASWNVDSWARDCPYHADQVWEDVDSNLVHPVSPGNMREVEESLRDVPILEISPPTAEHLAGQPLTPKEGTKFYLVRAVALNEPGRYELATREDMLWVNHGCMGGYPVWMKRRALVVQLRKEPREVYPDCHMAQ